METEDRRGALPLEQVADLASRCGIKGSAVALAEFAALLRSARPLSPEEMRPAARPVEAAGAVQAVPAGWDDSWKVVIGAAAALAQIHIEDEDEREAMTVHVRKIVSAIPKLDAQPAPACSAQVAQHPDDLAVDRFAAAMKEKMAAARAKGRGGWDDPEQCGVQDLVTMLVDHIEKGDPVDIGNFAMMLFNRGVWAGDFVSAMSQYVMQYKRVFPTMSAAAPERSEGTPAEPAGWREFIENIATPYSEPLNSVSGYRDMASRKAAMGELREKAQALLVTHQPTPTGADKGEES